MSLQPGEEETAEHILCPLRGAAKAEISNIWGNTPIGD